MPAQVQQKLERRLSGYAKSMGDVTYTSGGMRSFPLLKNTELKKLCISNIDDFDAGTPLSAEYWLTIERSLSR